MGQLGATCLVAKLDPVPGGHSPLFWGELSKCGEWDSSHKNGKAICKLVSYLHRTGVKTIKTFMGLLALYKCLQLLVSSRELFPKSKRQSQIRTHESRVFFSPSPLPSALRIFPNPDIPNCLVSLWGYSMHDVQIFGSESTSFLSPCS